MGCSSPARRGAFGSRACARGRSAARARPGGETDRARSRYLGRAPVARRARIGEAADWLAVAFRAGDQAESKARNEQALAVAREIGDASTEALALVGLSRVAFRDGDYGRACALAREARDLVVALDPADGVAPLHMLAAGTRLAGDYERARELYTESLMLNERLGSTGMISVELHNLAYVNLHRGDVGAAEECFAACSELRRNSGNPYDVAMEALNRAALSFAHGDPHATARLLAEARATLDDAGIQLDPDDRFEVDWLGAQLARA